MSCRIGLILLGIIICFLLNFSQANDVTGCGGFVVSSVSINYAPIQIKLYTNRGVLKYTSDCAPNNGYYFIPLYDTGDYVLRVEPPQGWTFDPMEVSFNFNGKTDICSKQTDVNFVFKGFTILGKVFSSSSSSGPNGVKVTLLSKANNNVIKQNTTLDNGLFIFRDILPGQYVVEASHDEWKFEQNRITVDVVNDNVNLQDIQDPNANNQIRVLGYSVSGKVVSDGQPINGVQFSLFAKDVQSKKIPCDESNKPSFISKLTVSPNSKYVCYTSSNVEGIFQFKTLPVGKYILYTFYEPQNIRFEVLPFKYEFEVLHNDLVIDKLFHIGGFTISGNVVNNLNPTERIKGTKVTLLDNNGKNDMIQVDVNSSKGSFAIENIKTSSYIIKTTAPHYEFDDVLFAISPNTPNLPVISPSKFEVCGKVILPKHNSNYNDVKLDVLKKDTNSIVNSVSIGEEDFCMFVSGGHYVLKINSKYPELRFTPALIELNVNKPEMNVRFEQFTAVISGQIEMLTSQMSVQDGQLSVTLAHSNALLKPLFTAELKSHSENRFQFKFANVLPGEYVIALAGKLTSLFCWSNDVIPVTIDSSNIDNVIFKQKGVFLQISLSHSTDLSIQSPSGKKVKIDKASIGSERIVRQCVDELGKYQITSQGCHKFSENEFDNFVFDTTSMAGQIVTLTAVQHQVTAHVRSASNLTDLSVKVLVRSLNEQYNKQIVLTDFVQLESPTDHSPLYQYSLSFYERPMVDIRLEPISSQLLFKPAFFEFKLKDDCYQNAVIFHGRFGLFVNGIIKPKIENVIINIFDNAKNELIFTTKTDSEGKYSGGPFDDDLNLRIEATKEGFVMKQIDSKFGHFEAHKLSSISTTIIDQNGEPLSDVLVSISGGENNFRKNSVANSDGRLNFENLHPGQYFIRFMRKEYEFEPASKMISLDSGDKHEAKVIGKKVAFSCLGIVDSLNREPESGVVVEAIGLRKLTENSSMSCSQIQEQAVTESDGTYRILGLHPECQYAIRLKIDDNEQIRESIPRVHSVRVHNSDLTDLRFVVLYKQFQMDLSASIKTDQEFISSLTVQLFRQDEPHVAIFKQSLSSSPFVFFPSIPLDQKQYIIRIDSDLSSILYLYSPIVHTFAANQSHAHFQFEFKPKARQTYTSTGSIEHEVSSNPLYSIPLLLLGVLIYYNKQIINLLKNFPQYRDHISSFLIKRNSQTINMDNGSKKKIKPKKIN